MHKYSVSFNVKYIMSEFESMNLKPELLSALKKVNFSEPTDVQKEAIPVVLSGKDVVVRAKTGTGKTGAFLIPITQLVQRNENNAVLIITPTRELALQVANMAEGIAGEAGLGIATVYGGASMNVQIRSLRSGVNIVVGTPGRLIDLMKQGELKTDRFRILVLDEADTMFDMGFIDDITYIMSRLPKNKQMLLFSATMPKPIVHIAQGYMRDPVYLSVGKEEEVTVSTITHYYVISGGREKFSILLAYISEYKPTKAIIFTETQRAADTLYELLKKNNFDATLMHGGLSQARREYSLSDFRKGTQFLIATNVAARGLDITDVSDIINFDTSEDPAVYVHRVGRSARMGTEGRAFSIFSPRDRYMVGEIEHSANIKMNKLELNLEPYKDAENFVEQLSSHRSFGGPRRNSRSSYGGGRFHSGPAHGPTNDYNSRRPGQGENRFARRPGNRGFNSRRRSFR